MGWADSYQQMKLYTYDKTGGEYTFYFTIDDHGYENVGEFVVNVATNTDWPPTDPDVYQLSLDRLDDTTLQTTSMENRGMAEFKGKGITEALLPELSRLLRCDIVSSRTFVDMSNRRSESATVIWQRLVASGIAEIEGDRFRIPYHRAAGRAARR